MTKSERAELVVREPMLWKKDINAPEQTKWEINKWNADDTARSVEEEQADDNSLYQPYKKLIHARRGSEILVRGDLVEVPSLHVEGAIAFKPCRRTPRSSSNSNSKKAPDSKRRRGASL